MFDPVRDMKETFHKSLVYFESLKEEVFVSHFIPENKKNTVHAIYFRGNGELFRLMNEYLEHLKEKEGKND